MFNTQNCTKAKFKVGDKVRRVGSTSGYMTQGCIYTVKGVHRLKHEWHIEVLEVEWLWYDEFFELFQEEQVQNQEDLQFKLLVLQKENELLTRMLLQGGEL